LDIYSSLSLIWRYSYCPVFQGATSSTDLLWPTQQRRIVEISTAETRGISLALTSAFMFCGIGFGSAVASWLYPLSGFYGVMISSVLFLLLALASLWTSEWLRARSAKYQAVHLS
ncbi:hypothetical protein V5077_22270, partial [Enterobacter kobei]